MEDFKRLYEAVLNGDAKTAQETTEQALAAIRLLRHGLKDGALKLHPREVPYLDRLQKTVEAMPARESKFIGEMMGEVDTTRFMVRDYDL